MSYRRTRRLGAYALIAALGLTQAGCGAVALGAAGAGAGYVAGDHVASKRADDGRETSPANRPQPAEAD